MNTTRRSLLACTAALLLPLPALDGGRLVFLIVEGIRRKPVPQKVEAYVHLTGYVLLFGLMIIMTYKDIVRIFQ